MEQAIVIEYAGVENVVTLPLRGRSGEQDRVGGVALEPHFSSFQLKGLALCNAKAASRRVPC